MVSSDDTIKTMGEELVTPKLTGFLPSPDSATEAYFKHLEECFECRGHDSLGLCATGDALLDQAAKIPITR
jgi:hypothetical protein